MTATSGNRWRIICSRPIFATAAAAKRFTPNGGVIMPSARLVIITRPKCTGSMPKRIATGARIGAMTTIEAAVSTNMPTRKRNTLTARRNITGPSKVSTMKPPIIAGMPARVMTKEKSPAMEMMNITMAADRVDERITRRSPMTVSSR